MKTIMTPAQTPYPPKINLRLKLLDSSDKFKSEISAHRSLTDLFFSTIATISDYLFILVHPFLSNDNITSPSQYFAELKKSFSDINQRTFIRFLGKSIKGDINNIKTEIDNIIDYVDNAGFSPDVKSEIYNELNIYMSKNTGVFEEAFNQKIKRNIIDIFLPIPIINGLASISTNTDLNLQSLNSNLYTPLLSRTYPTIQSNETLKNMFYGLATNLEVLAININKPSYENNKDLQHGVFDTFFNEKSINGEDYQKIKSTITIT